MDQLEYEEVIEWYNNDKYFFDTWELIRINYFYNDLVQLENPSDFEKELISWCEDTFYSKSVQWLIFKSIVLILRNVSTCKECKNN